MAGRVATCIWCWKLFKPGMVTYHGHAHTVALRWTWSSFEHLKMTTTCIRFPTPYASCDTSGHFIGLLLLKKIYKMQKLLKTKSTWHGVWNWSSKTMEKIETISRMLKNYMPSNEPSHLTRTIFVEHEFLWTSLKWPKLLHADGYAHARYSC